MQQSSNFSSSPAAIPSTGFSVLSPSLKSADPALSSEIIANSPSSNQRNKIKSKSLSSNNSSSHSADSVRNNGSGFVVHIDENMLATSANSFDNPFQGDTNKSHKYDSTSFVHSKSIQASPSNVSTIDRTAHVNNHQNSIKEQEKVIFREILVDSFSLIPCFSL